MAEEAWGRAPTPALEDPLETQTEDVEDEQRAQGLVALPDEVAESLGVDLAVWRGTQNRQVAQVQTLSIAPSASPLHARASIAARLPVHQGFGASWMTWLH